MSKRGRRVNKKIAIKIGGSTVNSSGLLNELGTSIFKLTKDKIETIVVHGGGKDIAKELERLNKEFTFVEGMRVTDAETMESVQRVLSGEVNKRIVNTIQLEGVKAVGISGVDGNTLVAKKLYISGEDIGFVGEIKEVNLSVIDALISSQNTVVLSPVSRDNDGNIYNVNADLAASEVAIAKSVDDLIFISDVQGVLIDGSVQSKIKISEIEQMITDGHITGGMIPKLRSAADAINRGVKRVHICGWHGKDTLAEELDENKSLGTTVLK
jgi:acetylglutamate kinase